MSRDHWWYLACAGIVAVGFALMALGALLLSRS